MHTSTLAINMSLEQRNKSLRRDFHHNLPNMFLGLKILQSLWVLLEREDLIDDRLEPSRANEPVHIFKSNPPPSVNTRIPLVIVVRI